MRKSLIIVSAILLVTAVACNRTAFVNKLSGSWSLKKYIYSGVDQTPYRRDTIMNQYKLEISGNQSYLESWRSLSFRRDTLVLSDTLSYDSSTSMYNIKFDTISRVDTTIVPYSSSGRWDLLNSESDLQLKDNSTNNIRIYRILTLTGSELDLQNGNEGLYLNK